MVANVFHYPLMTIANSASAELGKNDYNRAHQDSNGNTLEAIIGPFTFATLPAAASYTGVVARVSDVGRTGGSLWMSDGTIWRPVAPVKIYENTALVEGDLSGDDQVVLAMSYAANILTGKVFRVLATFGKGGTTDAMTAYGLRMGTNGTIADTQIGTTSGLTAPQRSIGVEYWFRMASVTSIEKLGTGNGGSVSWAQGGSSLAINTAATVTTVASAGYIDLTIDIAGTTDKPQVGYCAIEIMQ